MQNMQSLIKDFEKLCAGRTIELVDAKEQGAAIVEYTGGYVPEEIIYAAGAKAYPMWRGGEPEPPDAVLDETIRFLTPLVRTQYGLVKLGLDPVADIADVYAFTVLTAHQSRISELFERAGYPVCKVSVPADWTTPYDYDYYSKRVRDFAKRVEAVSGNKITDDSLREAIDKYNTIRGLLRELNDLRKQENPVISASEFIQVNHFATRVDPDVAIEQLNKILAAAKEAPHPEGNNRPRIVLFGSAVADGDYYVVRAVEDAGADIVCEILDECYFLYSSDVDTKGNPFDAIVKNRYRDRIPPSQVQPSWEIRMDAIEKAMKEYNADGVLMYDLLYDEIADMEYAIVADRMGEKNIPIARVQTSYEYTREAMGPLRTRVETFVANLKGGKR